MLFNTKYLIPDAGRGWGGNCIPCVNVLRGYYGCLYTAPVSASTSIDTSLSTCGHVKPQLHIPESGAE